MGCGDEHRGTSDSSADTAAAALSTFLSLWAFRNKCAFAGGGEGADALVYRVVLVPQASCSQQDLWLHCGCGWNYVSTCSSHTVSWPVKIELRNLDSCSLFVSLSQLLNTRISRLGIVFNLEQTSLELGSGVFGRCRFSKAPALPCSCTGLFVCFSLQCTSFIPEARAVLDLVDQCPKEVQKGKFQVIAIEGLDATGKTTLTQHFKSLSRLSSYSRHPPCIKPVEEDLLMMNLLSFEEPFILWANYLVASEIAKESTNFPVIVDRYWHSTATYAIATEVSGGLQYLPPAHHPVYQWPGDLLKPDLVLLLTVNSEERVRRLQGRGQEKTKEEAELEANNVFRQKVENDVPAYGEPKLPSGGCQPLERDSPAEGFRADPEFWSLIVVVLAMFLITPEKLVMPRNPSLAMQLLRFRGYEHIWWKKNWGLSSLLSF
nr:This ORF is capable of encoding 432 aa which is similar to thymidylate kinases especially at two domains: the p-loop or catalytic site and the substrate binding site; ORF [Mus musculus domesticus]prf//2115357A TYKi protein [Mus musculus]